MAIEKADGRGGPGNLSYQLFGAIRAEHAGAPVDLGGRKQRAVLAALLVDAGKVVTVDQLLDRVWGDAAPRQATASLQAYVSNLRRLLDPGRPAGDASRVIVTQPGGYRIEVDPDRLDLTRFEGLHDEGLDALAGGDAMTAATRLDAALALFGPVAPELAGQRWVAELATRLGAAHAEALEGLFEAKLRLGQDRGLLPDLEVAIAEHPFRERLRGQLALALYRCGRQTEALRSLAEARRTLVEEIGVEPGPDLRQLEADILAHAPALTPTAAGSPSTIADPLSSPASVTLSRGERQVGLIGRAAELEALVDAAAAARRGSGGVAVISGEPGIGKSRLAEELAAQCPEMVTAWTRCPESAAAAPGWTCTQLFSPVVAANVLDEAALSKATALATSERPSIALTDPGAERFEFHTAAAATLRSTDQPLLLIVDDLQWADPSSLRLLEFLAGELRTIPVLLVVTVRPLGPEPSAALVACLSELARHSTVRRLDLDGLDPADVELWMRRRSTGPVDPGVVHLVHDRTNGNPFFIGEVAELLAARQGFDDAEKARELGVPAAVQDVVRRRIDGLPSETRKLLSAAAVQGGTINLDLVAHITAQSVPAVLEGLDPAVDAGLLLEDRLTSGQLRFAHALVADALVADLSMSRRARLHAATVEALEDLHPTDLDDNLAKLVYHAAAGAIAGTGAQAVDYAVQAARLATDRRQHEDAAAYWAEALRLLSLTTPGDQRARLDALVELGGSRARAGDYDGAQQALLEAIDLAGVLGDAATAQRAAVLLPSTSLWQPSRYGETVPALVAALQRVLADLDDQPTAARAEILGGLADLSYYADPQQSDEWSAEAVSVARCLGDAPTLARSLNRRFLALQRPSRSDDRREIADEIVALARDPGLPVDLACVGHYGRAAQAFERGEVAVLESDLARSSALADQLVSPGLTCQVGWFRVSWLLARGHYDEARSLAYDTHAFHERVRRGEANGVLGTYLAIAAHDQGRLAEVPDELLTAAAEEFDSAMRELRAWMHAEDGQLERARALVGTEDRPPEFPEDWAWLAMNVVAALTRSTLADREACRGLYARLRPHSGLLAIAGPGGPNAGVVDVALARLAATLGDHEGARHHLDAAIGLLEHMGARPWLARALLTRWALLRRSDDPADRSAAERAADHSRQIATELHLVPVLAALELGSKEVPSG